MIVLLARAVGSAALVTVTVTAAKFGRGLAGAVYFPAALILPMAPALTPGGGVNDHVTAVFVVPPTLAENCRVPFTGTVTAARGSIATVTALAAVRGTVDSDSTATSTRINRRTLRSSVRTLPRAWCTNHATIRSCEVIAI